MPKAGRPEERLKIDLPLSEALKLSLSKKRPPEGWPRPAKQPRKPRVPKVK